MNNVRFVNTYCRVKNMRVAGARHARGLFRKVKITTICVSSARCNVKSERLIYSTPLIVSFWKPRRDFSRGGSPVGMASFVNMSTQQVRRHFAVEWTKKSATFNKIKNLSSTYLYLLKTHFNVFENGNWNAAPKSAGLFGAPKSAGSWACAHIALVLRQLLCIHRRILIASLSFNAPPEISVANFPSILTTGMGLQESSLVPLVLVDVLKCSPSRMLTFTHTRLHRLRHYSAAANPRFWWICLPPTRLWLFVV